MTLRPATLADERLFHEWRRNAETKGQEGGWYAGPITSPHDHHEWFLKRLGSLPLFVFSDGNFDVGCVRVESNGDVTAYAAPGNLADLLAEVKPLAAEYGGRLRVIADSGDADLVDALEVAGWQEHPARFFTHRL